MTDSINNGWIKLHRKILTNPQLKGRRLALWVTLLLLATHDEQECTFKGERITLESGQLITGRKYLSQNSGFAESGIESVLAMLEKEQQIRQQKSNKNRLITIIQWEKCQQKEQQTDNKVTTNRQQSDTYKKGKNVKNDDNVKKTLTKVNEPMASYGNEDVNKVLEALKLKVGISDFADSQKWQRIHGKNIHNLLVKIGREEFSRRLDIILKDSFKHKRCNEIKYIYEQLKGFIEPNISSKIMIA